jgi:hypothetical protein
LPDHLNVPPFTGVNEWSLSLSVMGVHILSLLRRRRGIM